MQQVCVRVEPLAAECDKQNISIEMGSSAVTTVTPVSPPPFTAHSKSEYVQNKIANFCFLSALCLCFSQKCTFYKTEWLDLEGQYRCCH